MFRRAHFNTRRAVIAGLITAMLAAGAARASAAEAPPSVSGGPPKNVVPPVISGNLTAGSTLSSTNGVWRGSEPMTFSLQWSRRAASSNGCTPIAGATAATYVLATADVGNIVYVIVTAKNSFGQAAAPSQPTPPIKPPGGTKPLNTTPPSISGTLQVGQTEQANPGTWSGT